MKHQYGYMVRILHWCTHQTMTAALTQMDLTAAQGRIMGYLAHRAEPPCPKDIEEAFQLSHPTVSGLLSRMEKKGFIRLETDPSDRRCRRIHLLPKGLQCHERIHNTIRDNESRIVRGFTEQEQEQFARLLDRAITNMGGDPCCANHKEESETND